MRMLSFLDSSVSFGDSPSVEKMPAHWLMARLGKRVLRPGGAELTRWLIEHAKIDADSKVVELAPGLGITAREILRRTPTSYVGVERDEGASAFCLQSLRNAGYGSARVVQGDASKVPADDKSATVVFGEAMLSMQTPERKQAIMKEARRLLQPGGCYAIHEMTVAPETLDPSILTQIQTDLSRSIHVGVRIGTLPEWTSWLEAAGFVVETSKILPMRLLELDRLVQDEGLAGTARFALNVLRTPGAMKRLLAVRSSFRKHDEHLRSIAIVARVPTC